MMTLTTTRTPTRASHRTAPWQVLAAIRDTWRSRQSLAALDDRLLNDIGLTQTEVDTETKRAFWDVPGHWRR